MTIQGKAYAYALTAVLLWSTVATAFKIALTDLSFIQLLWLSSLCATLFLFVVIVLSKRLSELRLLCWKDWRYTLLTGLMNPFLYYLLLFRAYELLPAQEALALNYSWVIMVVVFSILFLRQKIGIAGLAGIFIGFAGLLVIATKGALLSFKFEEPTGTLLALSSSIVWAAFWILNLKDYRDDIIKLFFSFIVGFIFITIIALFRGEDIIPTSATGLLSAIYIGLFEMGVTFVIWLRALKLSTNTAKVSILIFLSPFISLNLINIVLGEKILLSTVIGITMIVGGILIQKTAKVN